MRRKKNVGWLQVAVDQPLLVKRLDPGQHADRDRGHFRDRQRTARDAAGQGLPLKQLHREEQLPLFLANFVQLADGRVIHACRGSRLPAQPIARLRFGDGSLDHLDRHRPAEPIVVRGIHHPHAPLAEHAGDRVAPD